MTNYSPQTASHQEMVYRLINRIANSYGKYAKNKVKES